METNTHTYTHTFFVGIDSIKIMFRLFDFRKQCLDIFIYFLCWSSIISFIFSDDIGIYRKFRILCCTYIYVCLRCVQTGVWSILFCLTNIVPFTHNLNIHKKNDCIITNRFEVIFVVVVALFSIHTWCKMDKFRWDKHFVMWKLG